MKLIFYSNEEFNLDNLIDSLISEKNLEGNIITGENLWLLIEDSKTS